jgi:uncharacterized coiled-coil protein SlyX
MAGFIEAKEKLMFEVKGHQSQWKTIYDNLSRMQIGDVVSLKELAQMLPGVPATSVRPAFYRAMKEMQTVKLRTFVAVRGVGYRMVEANEHENLARGKHKSAKKQLRKAQLIAAAADRSRLTPDERRRLDELEHHLARQADMLKRLDDRQLKTEHRVALTEKDMLHLGDRVQEMESLLKRYGFAPGDVK